MKIAQVAPLSESVPPKLYGGTERVVSWLTEELVAAGHDVTLFASGDSITAAHLVPVVPRGLRLAGHRDHMASHLVMVDQVRKRAPEFDVIHFHVDLIQFPLCQEIAAKTVTTMHGRLDLPDFHPIYRAYPHMPLVSISDDQRRPISFSCNWRRTIHHGLPADLIPFQPRGGDYLAFLGRISPEKRPDRAIEIAKRAGIPLKIAAKVDPADEAYFAQTIEPLLDHPLIDFIGEIGDEQKKTFLGNALALLFPIDWCEPFGLVMIEAMSAGTPVIAWPHGSVPEVIEDGISGYLVSSIDDAVDAVRKVKLLKRARVRACFEDRFTAKDMARDYLDMYRDLVDSHSVRGILTAQKNRIPDRHTQGLVHSANLPVLLSAVNSGTTASPRDLARITPKQQGKYKIAARPGHSPNYTPFQDENPSSWDSQK